MKKIIISISLMFICLFLNANKNNQLNDMIISSLNSYITWTNDFVKQGISLRDTCHHYVCIDGLPAEYPYESINNITFFSLNNINGLPNHFKSKLKKGIYAYFVWIRLKDTQLIISVGGRSVKLIKRNHIGINIIDWGVFTYEYSCENQEWEIKDTQFGGV